MPAIDRPLSDCRYGLKVADPEAALPNGCVIHPAMAAIRARLVHVFEYLPLTESVQPEDDSQVIVVKNDEFCIINDELCVRNNEFCVRNDEFCVRNDEFCVRNGEFCLLTGTSRRLRRKRIAI